MSCPIPQKSFYYIRHGESEWNVLGQFAGGSVDTPLTQLGINQATEKRTVFEALSPQPTHIIHSTLSRAKDTADILNENRQCPMIAEYDLREIEAGEWEGIPSSEAKKRWAAGLHPGNGENLDMLADRLQGVFNKILSNEAYDMPLIAAHGRLMNGLDHLFGVPARNLQIGNCTLLQFIPSHNPDHIYPFDVYGLIIKNGQIHKELAIWSQI